jgi:predicted DCC family thiol-disulfide oxidoreductase YuxK
MDSSQQQPVLLYDGACGFCNATIQFILKGDRRGTLAFASLSSPYATRALAAYPELRGTDSMVWLESPDARPLTRSAAGLRIATYLGGFWRLTLIFWVVPGPIRDWVYDLIARHRHRLMRGAPRCVVPPPDARGRFLDDDSGIS